MIRNEGEHREAVRRLEAERKRLAEQRARLRQTGLKAPEIKRAMEPMESFHLQLKEEVEHYERLRRGDVSALQNLHGLGQALVSLRIALGLTQRDLAKRLGVDESQISRDERNEYHGITVERASRILDALGAKTMTTVRVGPSRAGKVHARNVPALAEA